MLGDLALCTQSSPSTGKMPGTAACPGTTGTGVPRCPAPLAGATGRGPRPVLAGG